MKLKTALKSLKIEALEQIAEFWELPKPKGENGVVEPDKWVKHIYPRLQNSGNFKTAYQKLTEDERNLVCFLAIHGGNMDEKELRKRCFKGNPQGMKETLCAMTSRGFLCREHWTDLPDKPWLYGLPEPFLRFIELPHFWQGHLGALLRDIPLERLQRIASNGLAVKSIPNKRDRLVYTIRQQLTDPEQLRNYMDRLPENQREVFLLLLQRRGVSLYSNLLEMIQGRRSDIARGDCLEKFLKNSALMFLESRNDQRFDNLLRIPRDVYHIITNHFVRDTRGLNDLDAMNSMAAEEQPKIILDNTFSVLRDLVIFTGYIARHSVRRMGNGGIGKNDLRKILPRLSNHKTPKYTQFLASYCIAKQILIPTGDHWSVSAAFEEKLTDSRSLYLDLYGYWLESRDWNEEYIDGDCLHTDSYPTNLINIIELRNLVLENLAEIPFDTWVNGPRFVESLLSQIEVRILHRSGKSALEKNNRINYLVIETVLSESLYWMGVISLGLEENTNFEALGNRRQVAEETTTGSATASSRIDRNFNFNPRPQLPDEFQFHFQITSLGRSLLSCEKQNMKTPPDQRTNLALPFRDDMMNFTILPNLDVVAPPDLNLACFYKLRQFTEIRSIDIMSTLVITHDSVRAGMDHGMQGDDILNFLQSNCVTGLPETVRHLVRECSSRYGELSIGYAGGYIRVDDPVLLEELRNNKTLAPFIKDFLGEQVILLNRNAQIKQVAKELQRLGFMPRIDSENVYTSSEGRLRFSLSPQDLGNLMSILQFLLSIEEEMDTSLTEDITRPLLHLIRPNNHSHLDLDHFTEITVKRFEKRFESALKRRVNSVANKYRKQMREILAQRMAHKGRPTYAEANPALKPKEIKHMLQFAIEHDCSVEIKYLRTTREETIETVRPESINGEKLFTYSEEESNYCAYRLKRILVAKLP